MGGGGELGQPGSRRAVVPKAGRARSGGVVLTVLDGGDCMCVWVGGWVGGGGHSDDVCWHAEAGYDLTPGPPNFSLCVPTTSLKTDMSHLETSLRGDLGMLLDLYIRQVVG